MNVAPEGLLCPTCKKVFATGDRCPADGSLLVQAIPTGALPIAGGKASISSIPRPSQFALQSGTTDSTDIDLGPIAAKPPEPTGLARLESGLSQLGGDHEPPAGWQARVLAAVAERPRRLRWPVFAFPVLAMAAATLLWLQTSVEVVSRVEIVRADEVRYRGVDGDHPWLSANANDYVHAVASTARPYHAIRIYHDNELLLACPGAAQCQSADGALTVQAQLARTGEYTILILEGDAPPQLSPGGDLDADEAAAIRAGVRSLERLVRVQ